MAARFAALAPAPSSSVRMASTCSNCGKCVCNMNDRDTMPDLKVLAISDLHGFLPENLPPCDLLLIAGDLCPLRDHSPLAQANWLATTFRAWLDQQQARE